MLGLGQNRRPVLALVSGLMTGALAHWLAACAAGKKRDVAEAGHELSAGRAPSATCGIGLRQGFVVDYFSFRVPLEKLRRIVFNLSDLFIFAGAGLMIVYSFFKRK